ncbi:MAG TPA: hypothetical protein VH934_03260 [Xanthobacteraceae bacterium]|jgi:hypothetical protein
MLVLDFLQNLPLPYLFAAIVAAGLVLAWTMLALVRIVIRLLSVDPAKSLPIHDLTTVTSILFALMLSFAAAGIWNDWVQARTAVQREALALENVLALADGLSPEWAAKVKAGVITYAKTAAEQEWPAMAREVDIDDPLFAVSDRALVNLITELSQESVTPGGPPISPMLMPQIFEARSARLARLTLASSGMSSVQWFSLVSLIAITLLVVALVYNDHAGTQMLAVNLCAVAAAAAFFVLLAHDRPFTGVISVSPRPLLQLIAKADAGVSRVVGSQPAAR